MGRSMVEPRLLRSAIERLTGLWLASGFDHASRWVDVVIQCHADGIEMQDRTMSWSKKS